MHLITPFPADKITDRKADALRCGDMHVLFSTVNLGPSVRVHSLGAELLLPGLESIDM